MSDQQARERAEGGGAVSIPTRCALCGRDPATGFAMIGDDRYCHGDEEPGPTCYMRGQWNLLPGSPTISPLTPAQQTRSQAKRPLKA